MAQKPGGVCYENPIDKAWVREQVSRYGEDAIKLIAQTSDQLRRQGFGWPYDNEDIRRIMMHDQTFVRNAVELSDADFQLFHRRFLIPRPFTPAEYSVFKSEFQQDPAKVQQLKDLGYIIPMNPVDLMTEITANFKRLHKADEEEKKSAKNKIKKQEEQRRKEADKMADEEEEEEEENMVDVEEEEE